MKLLITKILIISIVQFFINVNLFASSLIPVEGVSPVKQVSVVEKEDAVNVNEIKVVEPKDKTSVGSEVKTEDLNSKDSKDSKDQTNLVDKKSEEAKKQVQVQVQSQVQDLEQEQKEEYMKISYYLDRDPDNKLVVLPRGSLDGLREQVILRSYRIIKGVHLPTGTLKVLRVYPKYSIARVIEEGLSDRGVVGRYTSVMAGDEVREYTGTIYRKEQIVEKVELRYKDIFEEWDRDSLILNLSDRGKRIIRKKVEELLAKGVQKIMVESYAGGVGSYEDNQVESEQRGNIVKYFIDEEFGIDSDRVVVVGFGKSVLKVEGNSRESQETNRRIVIKAM